VVSVGIREGIAITSGEVYIRKSDGLFF